MGKLFVFQAKPMFGIEQLVSHVLACVLGEGKQSDGIVIHSGAEQTLDAIAYRFGK
jgi:hypothetical protein